MCIWMHFLNPTQCHVQKYGHDYYINIECVPVVV